MVTARKLDSGQVQVNAMWGDGPGGCKVFPCGCLMSPEDALRLSRDLRDAADPWGVDACIEWLRLHSSGRVNDVWNACMRVNLWVQDVGWLKRSDSSVSRDELIATVHTVAQRTGRQCPLGELCPVCHPPVPTDEELERMETEELIRWIEGTGHKVLYSTTYDPGSCPWSAFRYQPHSHLKADTILGLAQTVAAQLREEKPDE